MKEKNGFTLVELLAVIVLLAILVLLALPNIIQVLNKAKENVFLDEVKNIYKTAQDQIIMDSMFDNGNGFYTNSLEERNNTLKISNGKNLKYCIVYDKKYNITHVSVSSLDYSFTSSNKNGIKLNAIEFIDTKLKDVDYCSNNLEDVTSYTSLEYIESIPEKKQHIIIDYTFKQNTKIEVDGMVIKGDTAIFGARNAQNNILGTQRYTLQFISSNKYRLSYRKMDYELPTSLKSNRRHKWTVSEKGLAVDDEMKVNIASNKSSGVDSNDYIYLMCVNDKNRGGAINFGQVRIYSFKIYEGDKLVKDIIPVLDRKGEACMFDKINLKFYYNSSSGDFNHGPEMIEK